MNTTTLGTLVAGAALGYIFRDHISGMFKKEKKDMGAIDMGAVEMGAVQRFLETFGYACTNLGSDINCIKL